MPTPQPTITESVGTPTTSKSQTPLPAEAARVHLQLITAAGNVQQCLIDDGFDAEVTVSDGLLSYKGSMPAGLNPESEPTAHDEWAAKLSDAQQECEKRYGVATLSQQYRQAFWVADTGQREIMWRQFNDCIKAAGITEKPSPDLAEYPLGKQILASSPNSAQALEKCKDNTRGLWPSRTSKGDPRTTLIGTGLEP